MESYPNIRKITQSHTQNTFLCVIHNKNADMKIKATQSMGKYDTDYSTDWAFLLQTMVFI